ILGIVLDSRAFLIGTAGSSGWYTSAVNVTLLLMNGTSPPDSIWYRLDNGTWTQYAQSFVVVGDGVHTLDFNATDGAGLNEIVHHLTISIDTALPASIASPTGSTEETGPPTPARSSSPTANISSNISRRISRDSRRRCVPSRFPSTLPLRVPSSPSPDNPARMVGSSPTSPWS